MSSKAVVVVLAVCLWACGGDEGDATATAASGAGGSASGTGGDATGAGGTATTGGGGDGGATSSGAGGSSGMGNGCSALEDGTMAGACDGLPTYLYFCAYGSGGPPEDGCEHPSTGANDDIKWCCPNALCNSLDGTPLQTLCNESNGGPHAMSCHAPAAPDTGCVAFDRNGMYCCP